MVKKNCKSTPVEKVIWANDSVGKNNTPCIVAYDGASERLGDWREDVFGNGTGELES